VPDIVAGVAVMPHITMQLVPLQFATVQLLPGHWTSHCVAPLQSTVVAPEVCACTLQVSPVAHVTSQVSLEAHWIWHVLEHV
jgi:hypothetical protein